MLMSIMNLISILLFMIADPLITVIHLTPEFKIRRNDSYSHYTKKVTVFTFFLNTDLLVE